jgi:hypothetical protein
VPEEAPGGARHAPCARLHQARDPAKELLRVACRHRDRPIDLSSRLRPVRRRVGVCANERTGRVSRTSPIEGLRSGHGERRGAMHPPLVALPSHRCNLPESARQICSGFDCNHALFSSYLAFLLSILDYRPVRFAYQPLASSIFLSQQTSHQQSVSSTLLSEQTSTRHQPPANRTCCILVVGV